MSQKAVNPKDVVAGKRALLMLLSPVAKLAWYTAQYCGAVKYGMVNWRASEVKISVYLSALERHLNALLAGEWYDPEDQTLHLGNIMACCAIILDAKACGTLVDDRPMAVPGYRDALAESDRIQAYLADKYKDVNPKHWTIEDSTHGTPR